MVCLYGFKIIWIGIHKELLALAEKKRNIPNENKHPNDYFAAPNEYKGHICCEIQELTDDYIQRRRNQLSQYIVSYP